MRIKVTGTPEEFKLQEFKLPTETAVEILSLTANHNGGTGL